MIPHLDEGTIQALVHGELTHTAEADAATHAAGCLECRERIAVAREEDALVRQRLAALDVSPPSVAVADVIRTRRRQVSSGRWRRAAAIALLAGGAGIAWAIPAVRAFVGRATGRAPSGEVTPGRLSGATPDSARPVASAGGIAVKPGARFTVLFEATQARGEIRITLVDGPELSVIATGAAVPLESRQEELVVSNRGAIADYEITIPSGAPMVEVRIAGVRRFLKQGANISPGDAGRAASQYIIQFRQ